ncbi:hypothetical protein [Streptomyces sp. NBC_01235]|uniref:hypothetical protein n=1 Tax=Streptomyces sp. NBC_01235 TaxID=2903788 RepID=UPI002E146C16|nr:hypothetical protein OG289_25930 [Streptomyces sp. NBC_01235]
MSVSDDALCTGRFSRPRQPTARDHCNAALTPQRGDPGGRQCVEAVSEARGRQRISVHQLLVDTAKDIAASTAGRFAEPAFAAGEAEPDDHGLRRYGVEKRKRERRVRPGARVGCHHQPGP